MNRIVSAWQKYENKIKYEGPDSITIDGEKIRTEEGTNGMAARKKPHITPVRDNDVVNKNGKAENSLVVNELSEQGFYSVIYTLLTANSDKSLSIRTASWGTLKRLRVKRDTSEAISKIPKNVSAQWDSGTLVQWMNNIESIHKTSIKQLVAIDATAVSRTQ